MKFIKVRVKHLLMNDKGMKKLESLNRDPDDDEAVNEEGKNAEWFKNLGLPVPEDLKSQNNIAFDETDYDPYETVGYIKPDKVESIVDLKDGGCTITTDLQDFTVYETADEIQKLITKTNAGN